MIINMIDLIMKREYLLSLFGKGGGGG